MTFSNFFTRICSRSPLKPGTYLMLADEEGVACAAVLALPSTELDAVRGQISRCVNRTASPPAAVSAFVGDALLAASPVIAAAVKSGHLLQVAGTPRLLAGLSSGAYSHLQAGGAMLGGVVNSSHQFVGQLRFTPASVPAVVGPMIVWQVLHAIAGVHHMVKIERQLSLLHRGIQQILVRLGARAYAELQAAIECLQDLDAEYRVVGRFTDDMRLRLAIAHRDVRRVFAEERLHYDEFTREKKAVLDETGATGAARVVSLLREKPEYLLDVDLFLTASRASVMVHQACLARDLEHAPEAIPLRLASIRKEADALTELVNAVSEVKQLKAHADACVQSLSWLRRNPRWGVAADVAALGADQKESSAEPDDAAEPCLMMWQERAGLIRTVVVDNARFGPTEDRLPGPS